MFSLIISIIAIALVVALAGASLYYGGDAFTQGNAKSLASTYTNQAQQITAAFTLAKAEGTPVATIDALATDYLSAIPTPPQGVWAMGTGVITAPVADGDICAVIELQAGTNGLFGCETVAAGTDPVTPESYVYSMAL